jgi:hemoglobin
VAEPVHARYMTVMSSDELRVTAGGQERRSEISAEIAARTGIDDAMIERLVRAFYGKAAKDPVLGPIFDKNVADWELHIATLCDFWSSVALMTGRYHGTPMATHMALPLNPEAFDRWLCLFSQAARDVCPEAAATHFIERASRIASSLEMGAAARRGEITPPRR